MSAAPDDTTDLGAAPTVSVVVPTHDRPQLVTEAVRAIVAQDHPGDVEVLVVFDKADPHPIDVELPAGRTLRRLRNDDRTPGLPGARNTGILAASGELLAFCDDDDAWLPGKLAAQVETLRRHPDASLVATGLRVVSDAGSNDRPGPRAPVHFDDLLRDRIMELHPSTFLFRRRDLLDHIGLVDEEIPGGYAEDYELLLRSARTGPIVNVPRPLVAIGFHAGSYYASRWRVVIGGLRYLLDRYPDFARVPAGRARILGQLAFAHAALGERTQARALARAALADHRGERRAYAAWAVTLGVPARWIADLARRRGRGI